MRYKAQPQPGAFIQCRNSKVEIKKNKRADGYVCMYKPYVPIHIYFCVVYRYGIGKVHGGGTGGMQRGAKDHSTPCAPSRTEHPLPSKHK